jgi:serine/threonine protein kinase/regulator of sirC expression with transglutaminase-like and TPR domain
MLESVGRYKILSPLGRGAMGVVYLAEDPVLGRQVALKTIDFGLEDEARRQFLRGRLLRDARAAASLSHPNVVSVFDIVDAGATLAVIMEYVPGENLGAYLSRNPVADPRFAAQIVKAMAAALDYTHSRGVVHRDIKPANVMLDASRIPKITDFGIARVSEGVTTTVAGSVMGTIEYMAPEQIKGEAVDGRVDQFALAVVTYRMLTGQTLFGEHSMATLAYKIVNELPAPVCSRNSWLPPTMDAIIAKALSKEPQDRYATCMEFAEAVTCALGAVDREAPTVAISPIAPAPKANSKLPALVFGCAVVAVAAGLMLWRPWSSSNSHGPETSAEAVRPAGPVASGPQIPPAQPPAPQNSEKSVSPPDRGAPAGHKIFAKLVVEPATPSRDYALEIPPKKVTAAQRAEQPQPVVLPPVSAEDAMAHGRELMKSQDYAGAIQAFSKVADLRPQNAQAYTSRGNAYQALEQFEAAIRDYDHAIRINPAVPGFYAARGACYMKLQKDDLALADLNQSLALKPDAPAALSSRARLYMALKDFHKALADWTEVISLQPENIQAHRQRANTYRALGDKAAAQADIQTAAELAAKRGG